MKGPDFPTGAQILGRQGILDAYRTGRGSVKMRAVAEIEEGRDATRIVVTELPYQTSVEVVEQKIARPGASRASSTGSPTSRTTRPARKHRLVIRLKRDANANVVLNKLYKHTPLQTSFGVNMLALVDGVPRTLNLAQVLTHYVAHQVEVVTRRTRVPAAQGAGPGPHRRRACCGPSTCSTRSSPPSGRPTTGRRPGRALMAEPFSFSEEQANHILDMTLGRLTRLGRTELEEEMAKLRRDDRRAGGDPGRPGQAARR